MFTDKNEPPKKKARFSTRQRRSKYNPNRTREKILDSAPNKIREKLLHLIPGWVFTKETFSKATHACDSQLFELMNQWQNYLIADRKEFVKTFDYLIHNYYPTEKKTVLDRLIAIFCMLYPQHCCILMSEFVSMIKDHTIQYRRSTSPFGAIISSISDTFDDKMVIKDKRKPAVLGWVEPQNSVSLLSSHILEYLWIVSKINIEIGCKDINENLEHLAETPFGTFLVDCLMEIPQSLRESFFTKLLKNHFAQCFENYIQYINKTYNDQLNEENKHQENLLLSRTSYLCEILHFFRKTRGFYTNYMITMIDSFIPILIYESEIFLHEKLSLPQQTFNRLLQSNNNTHSVKNFIIWMKSQILKDFEIPLQFYFTQASTLRTHKLLQNLFLQTKNYLPASPSSSSSSSSGSNFQVHIAEEENFTLQAKNLPILFDHLFPKIINQILIPTSIHDNQNGNNHDDSLTNSKQQQQQQELYDRPLIILIFQHLFYLPPISSKINWFSLHFLPTMLDGIEKGGKIAKDLLQMIFEENQYFPLLYQQQNSNSNTLKLNFNSSLSSPQIDNTGIQSLFTLLYQNHSKETREIVFKYWFHSLDIIEDELLVLSCATTTKDKDNIDNMEMDVDNMSETICGAPDSKLEQERTKSIIIQQQWEKLLNVLYICKFISNDDFMIFVEKSFLRFLSFLSSDDHHTMMNDFYSKILFYFLFHSSKCEEKLFFVFLKHISNTKEHNKNNNNTTTTKSINDNIYSSIRNAIAYMTRIELPSLRSNFFLTKVTSSSSSSNSSRSHDDGGGGGSNYNDSKYNRKSNNNNSTRHKEIKTNQKTINHSSSSFSSNSVVSSKYALSTLINIFKKEKIYANTLFAKDEDKNNNNYYSEIISIILHGIFDDLHCLENLFQILCISSIEKCKEKVLELFYLASQCILEPENTSSGSTLHKILTSEEKLFSFNVLKNFWTTQKIHFLLEIIMNSSSTLASSQISNLVIKNFQLICVHFLDMDTITIEFIPFLCSFLCNNNSNSDNNVVVYSHQSTSKAISCCNIFVDLIDFFINSYCNNEQLTCKFQFINSILLCIQENLYFSQDCEINTNFVCSPNVQILSLLLSTYSYFREISSNTKNNHEEFNSSIITLENVFFEIFEEALAGIGSYPDDVFLAQLQLLSSFCCYASNKRTKEILHKNHSAIEKVRNKYPEKYFIFNHFSFF